MNWYQKYLVSSVLMMSLLAIDGSVLAVSLFNESNALLNGLLEEAEQSLSVRTVDGSLRLSRESLEFYQRRQNKLAWTDESKLLPQAYEMIDVIAHVDEEGLRPEDYHSAELQKTLRDARDTYEKQQILQPETLVAIDLLLTRVFFKYASHLLYGKLNPRDLHPHWRDNTEETGLIEPLTQSLSQGNVRTLIQSLIPEFPDYQRLKRALAVYNQIKVQGGWPTIGSGVTLKRGDHDSEVRVLRKRLEITGDLKTDPEANQSLFDENVETALKRFQTRHGLSPLGILESLTRSTLNISVDKKIQLIEINLERWRWLARHKSFPYLLVDIASYRLDIIDQWQSVFGMNVIVGEPERPTPVMDEMITDVVINPYWYVPKTILLNDIISKELHNPNYLRTINIKIFTRENGEMVEVDPLDVDWANIEDSIGEFQFRQSPGPDNFLGRYKFIMTNDMDIYLHDTLFKSHFDDRRRDLSSGCVRVEHPDYLAAYLLKNEDDWSPQHIEEVSRSGDTRRIRLTTPMPIYILYWTVRVDQRGTVFFLPDFYKLDKPMIRRFYTRKLS